MSYALILSLIQNQWLFWLFAFIFVSNIFTILYMIFKDNRNPQKILLWFVTILTFPIIGFIFFLYLGKGPSFGKKRKILKKIEADSHYMEELNRQSQFLNKIETVQNQNASELIQFNIMHNKSVCTFLNDIKVYTDIKEHYDDMLKDILSAKESINFQYFIIKPDPIGKMFRDALTRKAKEGVKVRVLYDDFGSIKVNRLFFKELKKSGGEVYRFFPSFFRIISRNVNYRNHRKIVVIDGKISYMGGANIGQEYIGIHKRITPWRDTHMRIVGKTVDILNMRFMQDFNFAGEKEGEFTVQKECLTNNILPVQVVSDGPDSRSYGIEKSYIKAIYSAKKSIYIQTPYFVPSCCLMTALKTAAMSGIDVRIMIPKVPDKPYAYYCTTSFTAELVKYGAKIDMWQGFIHSKTLVIDDCISSIGTVNMDYRSFNLHFEVTAFVFDEDFGIQMREIYENDLKNSTPLDLEYIKNRGLKQRFLERIMRLFSSLM